MKNKYTNEIKLRFDGHLDGEELVTEITMKLKEPILELSQEAENKRRKIMNLFYSVNYAAKK